MKITDVKTYTMDAYRTNWTFIKVETDEELYGWGEASLGTREHALMRGGYEAHDRGAQSAGY